MKERLPDKDQGRRSHIAGNALTVFSATVIALAIGFATSIIVARLLGPEGRGLLGVGFSVATIVVAAVSLGIPIATTYYASRRPRLMPTLVGNAVAYACVLAVVLPLAALAVAEAADSWLQIDHGQRFWLLVSLLTWAMYLEFVSINVLRGRSRYTRLNALTVTSRVVVLALTVVFVAWLDLGVNGAVLALAAGSLAYSAIALAADLRRGVSVSRVVFAASVKYGWKVQAGRLIQLGNGRLDVLVMSTLVSLDVVGVYVVAQVVAELAALVPTAIGFVAMPAIARGGRTGQDVAGAVRLSGSLSLVGVVGVAIVAPPLITFGYGAEFTDALGPVYILLPGVWLLGIGGVIAEVMRGRGHPGVPALLAGLAIVVTVVLDLVLIPPYEAIGAAVASTCAYSVFGLASIVVLGRMEQIPRRRLFLLTRLETVEALRSLLRLRGKLLRKNVAGRDES